MSKKMGCISLVQRGLGDENHSILSLIVTLISDFVELYLIHQSQYQTR